MARTRNLEVVITGDARSLNRAFGEADRSAGKLHGRLGGLGKAFGVAGTAAAGALVVGLTKATQAAVEAEKSQARMVAQLRASGINYRAHAKEIDNVIQRTSKLAAVDDEDLQDAFTNIVRSTGSVSKSLHLTGLAADLAAAKHISLEKAGTIVGKVAAGNTAGLARYGITLKKGADATEALGAMHQKFKGQAEAYGKTTAGSMDRARNSLENLGEAVGAKTAPMLAKAADAFSGLITGTSGAGRAVRSFATTVRNAFDSARAAVSRFVSRNREDINAVISAVRNLGRFFRNVFDNVILPTVRAALPGIRQALNGIITVVRGLVRVVSGIINGDWDRVWRGLKDIVRGAVGGLVGVIRAEVGAITTAIVAAGKGLGSAIVKGIVSAFSGIGNSIKNKLTGALGALNPFGDGLGKQIGDGMGKGLPSIPNLAGVPSGSLQGANSALSPFAQIGSRFGLHVSSGKRAAGGRTASGGISYHGSGEAIDMADGRGPDQQKLGFFRYMKSNFGSRLAELIYTPGGAGIKDGHPFTYTGDVAADHYDHVHVALDLGRPGPGIGDGPGKGALATINAAAHAAGIDPAILYGVWGQESDFSMGPGPTSPAGAQGPFQFMPATARSLGVNPHDFRSAAYGAARYLSQYKGRGTAGMLAAYNAGPGAKPPYPRETQNYIPSVIRISHRWPGAGSGASRPGASAGSAGTGSASHPAADTTSPYDLAIAGSDVDIAEAQQGGVRRGPGGRVVSSPGLREAQAQSNRLGIVNRRITKIRKALKKHLTPATRLRLRQELAQLYGERSTIQGRITELYTAADTAGADTGGAGGAGAGGEDQANQALIDAIQANTEAQQVAAQAAQEQAQRLADVHSELKRQTDFATSISSTDNFQLKKAIADYVSGMIGGYGVAPRAFTPGSAVAYRY